MSVRNEIVAVYMAIAGDRLINYVIPPLHVFEDDVFPVLDAAVGKVVFAAVAEELE